MVAVISSMLLPFAVAYTYCTSRGYALTKWTTILLFALLSHLPFSMYYHARAALSCAGVWPLRCARARAS